MFAGFRHALPNKSAATTALKLVALLVGVTAFYFDTNKNIAASQENIRDFGFDSIRAPRPNADHVDDTDNYIKEKAGKKMEKGDYESAFRLLLPLAEKGDPGAQFIVSVMYGREMFEREMFEIYGTKIFEKSAEHPYLKKDPYWGSIPKNKKIAKDMLSKSVSQNYLPAMHMAGYLHLYGGLYKKDEAKGLKFLEKSVNLGYWESALMLMIYHYTNGNYSLSQKWRLVFTACTTDGMRRWRRFKSIFFGLFAKEMFDKKQKEGEKLALKYFEEKNIECGREMVEKK